MAIEFKPWPKISRLNREIVITEKIDGTNAAGGIVAEDDFTMTVYAQSRTRLITPENDNFGFAKWVHDNAVTLLADLGPGLHFGEWWGQGIQRKYGLDHKRFSLFNVAKWEEKAFETPNLNAVPVLYRGPFDHASGAGPFAWAMRPWERALDDLQINGSSAAPGFMRPEGIVVFHTASQSMFKVTLEGDAEPKSLAKKAA